MPAADASQLTSRQRSLLHQILAYVVAHPEAKDTLEGIRKWWGLEGRAAVREDEVQGALDVLVARDWMIKREVTPAPRIYGVNKNQLTEIRAFLQELELGAEGDGGRRPRRMKRIS
jgi:hypothetical protein